MVEEAGGINSCDTCTPLKGDLLSSVRIEHIILGLRRCVTHKNREPWGQFQDLRRADYMMTGQSGSSLIAHSIVKFHIAAQSSGWMVVTTHANACSHLRDFVVGNFELHKPLFEVHL